MRPSIKCTALALSIALLTLTGFSDASGSARHADARVAPSANDPAQDVVVVFVVWGTSNMGNQGRPGLETQPLRDPETLAAGIAYEWSAFVAPDQQGCTRFQPLVDEVPTLNTNGCEESGGSLWHALADAYHRETDRVVFMTSASKGSSGPRWMPGEDLYHEGLTLIDDAMDKARAEFQGHTVVFGGVLWNAAPGMSYRDPSDPFGDEPHIEDYPWAAYRADLYTLLESLRANVFENPQSEGYGGRFYFINTIVRGDYHYRPDDPDHRYLVQKVDYAQDLEADVCGAFAFCSAIQESVAIKEAQVACFDDPGNPYFENPRCGGWYAFNNAGGTNIEPNHWGQAGLNQIGRALGTTAAAHATGDPVAWEIGVEVPQPAEWCEAPEDVPCDGAVRSIRLDVYADDGTTRLHTATVAPSLASPDWTADFDPGPDAGADWPVSWASLGTDFLTVELVEVDGEAETPLARYVYVPGAIAHGAATGFHRPTAGGAPPAPAPPPAGVHFEVAVEAPGPSAVARVRARSRPVAAGPAPGGAPGGVGAFYEAAPGFAAHYVMPYDHAAFALACAAGGLAVSCPQGAPDHFLARVPVGDPRPTASAQRYAFAEAAAAVVLPHDWGANGVLGWSVPGLVLAFPEGRRLEVEGTLVAEGVRLTAADAEAGWGGVGYFASVPEASALPSVLRGSVVEQVRAPSVGSGGLMVPYGAVSVHGRELVVENAGGTVSQIRDGGAGVVGLLATGGAADVTVTGFSQIHTNGGGGVLATGGARVTVSGDSEVRNNPGGAGVTASGYGTLITLVGASVLDNGGAGVRALSGGEVRFANADTDPATHVERNAGGLDAGSGGSLDAGQCTTLMAPCDDRTEHVLLNNAVGGHFDARALTGSTLYAQGNQWHTTDITQLVLVDDLSSVLVVCPIVGGGACEDDARLAGGTRSAGPEGEPPLRIEDVLALVDEAERARLAGDLEAFEIAASAAVAAMDTSRAEDERRAAFEVTARLFAWDQPAAPLAALEALAATPGEGRPWALRALGVARASAEDYAAARAVADSLVAGYAESEHAAFGLALAVRVGVLSRDEAAAVAALVALAAAFPEADEIGSLAALVVGAFPGADLSGLRLGAGPGAVTPGAPAQASASSVPTALLTVGEARPNPSPGRATVPFELGAEAQVEAVLYDVLGRRVAVLASGKYAAGRHTLTLDGPPLPSGTYVVYVTARSGAGAPPAVAVRRLTLTR